MPATVINDIIMPAEKSKMLAGELYDAADPELANERLHARLLLKRYNDLPAGQQELRQQLLKELIPSQGAGLWIEPPFYCDYGTNISLGDKVYFNFNCIILDVMQVTIGSNVLIGPAVQIYTAMHPMNWKERASGVEFAKAISIGSDTWVGGGAIICPGVTVGSRSVIGAGSVVTRDIPDNVFAAGNPCRVIRVL
jgi:maltose O-acetyltransferase